MIDLNEIAVFVSVAQLGSFTRAARALAMPVSTVSRRICRSRTAARRDTDTADDAKAHLDDAGTRLLRSLQRAARAPLRRRTRADAQPAPTRGQSTHLRAGDSQRSIVSWLSFGLPPQPSADPRRPLRHQPDARPRGGKHRLGAANRR